MEILVAEKIYSYDEYLEIERESDERIEFVEGNLIFMPGESKKSNKIAFFLAMALFKELNEDVFEIFTHDIKLRVKEKRIYRYPDLMVAPVVDDDSHLTTQPILLAEVLSESTKNTDRYTKYREYTSLPTVQYYLIIHQEEPLIELYSRNGDAFIFSFFDSLKDIIQLPFFKISVALKDIYQKIELKK